MIDIKELRGKTKKARFKNIILAKEKCREFLFNPKKNIISAIEKDINYYASKGAFFCRSYILDTDFNGILFNSKEKKMLKKYFVKYFRSFGLTIEIEYIEIRNNCMVLNIEW